MTILTSATPFMIKHESENDWVDIGHWLDSGVSPSVYRGVSPTKVRCSHNLISFSYNDIFADMHDLPIAQKAKIIWKFDATESIEDLDRFITVQIYNKIVTYKSRVFNIKSWVPGFGYVQAKCYLGSPTNFDAEGVMGSKSGSKTYKAASGIFELHWIELGDSTTHLNSLSDLN